MSKPVGFAITQQLYSAADASRCLYLEAIYIKPEYRSKNLGGFLFKQIAQKALDKGYLGLSWDVNDFNIDALRFYEEKIGASKLNNIPFFMPREALETLVGS